MSEAPAVIYLETDDEVTSVIRRLRAADPGPIVVVAPGRSRATSSVVALRLLGRAADSDEREVRVVGDALTRSLAAEAGLSAFATLEEARRAGEVPAPAVEPRHAEIHVVRGPVTEETAPTLAAAAPIAAAPMAAAPSVGDDEMTRQVPVVRPAPRRAVSLGRTAAGRLPLAVFGAIAALLIGAVVAGATLLPAATVTIAPRTVDVGPLPYTVVIDDPERLEGTATATAVVVATGTYAIQEAATGSVVFLNWNFVPVEVATGTLVAAGEQAFATTEAVTVPPGELNSEGRIQAGEGVVGVVAAAVGPAANVEPDAIDVILDSGTAARLRGFPNNTERLVTNPDATAGGVDTTGPEFIQADVDAAVEALRADLAGQIAGAATEAEGGIAVAAQPTDPVTEGLNDLVGTRDEERREISGTQAWTIVVADEADIVAAGTEMLLADEAAIPEGHELLPDSAGIRVGEPTLDGEVLRVEVAATARAAVEVSELAVREGARGRSADEAEAVLAALGIARVELWPGWVTTVPEMDWRVEVQVVDPEVLEP